MSMRRSRAFEGARESGMTMLHEPSGAKFAAGGQVGNRFSGTAADTVHRWMRQEIVTMTWPPGATISEKEIAAAHHVSRTPVREALLRLAEEGLVEIVPKSGTRVARIPIVALADAMCAREALELMLARKAARRARPSDVVAMRAIALRQRECVGAGDAGGFHEGDEALHLAIATAAGHPGVWAMVLQIKVQLDRLRRLTLPNFERLNHVVEEHEAVIKGIESRDPDRAAAAMQDHLHSLKGVLGDVRNLNPDFFLGDPEDFVEQGARDTAEGA
jgi:GntR family transcriptional regulator, rspAB operon transcriptional repressor